VTGPKVNFGQIHIQGLQRVHESLLRGRLPLHHRRSLQRVRHRARPPRHAGLGVFNQVSLQIGTAVDDTGGVPITFKVASAFAIPSPSPPLIRATWEAAAA